jgi:hypothetical protein
MLAGCVINGGINPTPATLNFPIAVSLSREPTPATLFVVNSNQDLRFNSATIQGYSLDAIEERIAAEGCATAATPCAFTDLGSFLVDEVGIGSHADGLTINAAGSRLFLPVRSDENLTFIDWDWAFHCGEGRDVSGVPICDESFRAGDEAVASRRGLTLDGDPVAVATVPLSELGGGVGDFVLMALRDGQVALFLDGGPGSPPELLHIVGDLPGNLVTMTVQPGTGVAWITSAASSALARVGIQLDPVDPLLSFVYDFGALTLGGVDDGQDTRDVQFHPTDPEGTAFVLARRPEAVIQLDLTRPGLNATDVGIDEVYEVGRGPSRLAVTQLFGTTYAFASCFDARRLFVIDIDHRTLVSVIGGFTGPFEIVVDPVRSRLYIADFTTSVIRVVDLSPLATSGAPRVLTTLGEPIPIKRFAN